MQSMQPQWWGEEDKERAEKTDSTAEDGKTGAKTAAMPPQAKGCREPSRIRKRKETSSLPELPKEIYPQIQLDSGPWVSRTIGE